MAATALPTGRVVFAFTDIEGSTRLSLDLEQDRWQELRFRHRELVRAAVAAHGGHEVNTWGDGFFLAFDDPQAAVAAAVDAQRAIHAEPWPAESRIRVRIGLHPGDGTLDGEGDYVSADVARAARIEAAANGGQVLLSDELASLVRDRLPAGVALRRTGEHRLKDLRPEPLWDLVVEGLPADFPPVRSLDSRPNNLPVQLTSFVGREAELEAADALLGRTRLLTLTGPGGTGKTRLSLQLAARIADRFPDGVWFVPLESITDSSLVLPAIATTVGVTEMRGRTPSELIVETLAGRDVLLVLDNLEQVAEAAPGIAGLLRELPRLSVIATSRAVLRVSGEQEFPVPGLPGPAMDEDGIAAEALEPSDRDALMAYEAIRLFVARAAEARPGFALTGENAAAVAAIVARLEGMPLALELAAARVRALTPAAILDRLGHTLDLLVGGARDLPERQRSLRGAITWSYEVLDDPCRRLLERLSVFAGSAALADVEAVCGPVTELGQDVLNGLTTLAEQSLVRLDEDDTEPRYRLLVPIREFAAERLEARGEAHEIRDRHARRFLELIEAAAPNLTGRGARDWLDRLDRELQNLRAAHDHLVETDETRDACRFIAGSWRYWQIRGRLLEGIDRTRAVLALPGVAEVPDQHVAATKALGGLAWWRGDYPLSTAAYGDVLERQRRTGDDRAVADALYDYGFPLQFSNPGASRAAFEEALELYTRLGDADGVARAWWGIANSHYTDRDWDAARAAARRAAEHFRESAAPFDLGWSLYTLGQVAVLAGEPEEARSSFVEALGLFREVDDLTGTVMTLDGLAAAAWRAGDLERAAALSGAVSRLERTTGAGLNQANRDLSGFDPGRLRAGDGTARAWATGERASVDEIVTIARREHSAPG